MPLLQTTEQVVVLVLLLFDISIEQGENMVDQVLLSLDTQYDRLTNFCKRFIISSSDLRDNSLF
jgi:hypothetical protein